MVKGGSRKGSGRKSKPYRFLEVGGFCENLNHQLLDEIKRSRVKASLPAYDEAVSDQNLEVSELMYIPRAKNKKTIMKILKKRY